MKGSIAIFVNNTGYLKTGITYSLRYLFGYHPNAIFFHYFEIQLKETSIVQAFSLKFFHRFNQKALKKSYPKYAHSITQNMRFGGGL